MVKEWQTRDDFVAREPPKSRSRLNPNHKPRGSIPRNPRRVGIKAGNFATLRRPPLVNSREKNCGRRTSFSSSVISARGPPSPTPYSWSSLRAPPWADEESPARSPAAQIGSIYPTRARIKKPISGKPEIGAHFVSFNFLNTTIRLPRQEI